MKYLIIIFLTNMFFIGSANSCDTIANAVPINLDRAQIYTNGNPFDGDIDGNQVVFYGTVNTKGTGLVLSMNQGIPLNNAKYIVLQVKGFDKRKDKFYLNRLLKLEIDNKALKAKNLAERNEYDTSYVNAKNGYFYFKIKSSTLKNGKITKFLISFYGGEKSNKTEINQLEVCAWLTK